MAEAARSCRFASRKLLSNGAGVWVGHTGIILNLRAELKDGSRPRRLSGLTNLNDRRGASQGGGALPGGSKLSGGR
ncbi:MAG TPA: hypothetical protein VEX70_10410 [Pyrinomonadaceae bacterium]|nr:hypothetical protein [Pyrinomonadaceae bacterium]